mmetsp:Transcript_19084/g.45255  ORF Transcript_19084/g.45255 Transcript_19084/m.45255 type:complete len:98 (+) Transcript_19084:57-350(+)
MELPEPERFQHHRSRWAGRRPVCPKSGTLGPDALSVRTNWVLAVTAATVSKRSSQGPSPRPSDDNCQYWLKPSGSWTDPAKEDACIGLSCSSSHVSK